MDTVFQQTGLILAVAALGGVIAQYLRQPLIVAFIAVGILLGPSAFSLVEQRSEIELFARLGIALLLFVVGLKLDLHIIRTVGPVALASGLGQVLFTSVIGYLIAILLGLAPVQAIYVAVALTFSSTIIIVKLLSDKREVDTLHGRIAIGFLIVQDIVVVLVMIGLTAFGQSAGAAGNEWSMATEVIGILGKGFLMLGSTAIAMRYILPPLLDRLAKSTELLLLFAIAWAIMGAAGGQLLGFSKEVGAFLAGISIASTAYREQIAARLVSLRDFLLLFFFIELGAGLDLGLLGGQISNAILFSLFVLVGNPLIVMMIMGYMGYRRRTGFLAGLTVAQISEFSLVLAALGLSLGHLNPETVGLITLVGLITISLSTYMILYSHPLFERLAPWLAVFERKKPYRELNPDGESGRQVDILLFGLGRFGAALADALKAKGYRLLMVDFDPELVQRYVSDGYDVRFGDAETPEFVASLPLGQAKWVVTTLRDRSVNTALLKALQEQNYSGRIALTAYNQQDRETFSRLGVAEILIPYSDAASKGAQQLDTAGVRQ